MTYHLGADIGTTFTAAAVAREGRAEAVTLGASSVAVPSVAYLGDSGELVFGQAAVRRAVTEPSRVTREFKRRVGDPTPVVLGGTPIPAEMLMARLLSWVVDRVSESEGGPPASIAVTHPANWGRYKLDLLEQAIRQVGLEVAHFVPEPVAAASFYASQRSLAAGSVVAVYDLGGGTFDAALVRSEPPGFVMVGQADGVERLGGIDFDHAVLQHVVDAVNVDLDSLDREDAALAAALGQLKQGCVDGKEALSSETDTSVPVMLPGLHTTVRLTRGEFEGMIRPALEETLVALKRTIASADLISQDVSAVLLVGGSSRIPLVDQLVVSALDRPTAVDARPKDAICMGAALSAAHSVGPATPAEPPRPASSVAPGSWQLGPPGLPGPPLPPGPPGPLGPPALSGSPKRLWLGVAALLVGAGLFVGFLLASGDDDGDPVEAVDSRTTATESPTTTDTPTTTSPTTTESPTTTQSPTTTDGSSTPSTPPDTTPTSGGKALTVDGSEERWAGSCYFPGLGTSRPVMESPGKCADTGSDFYVRTAPHGSTEVAVCWQEDASIRDNQLNESTVWLQLDDGNWMNKLYFVDWPTADADLPPC